MNAFTISDDDSDPDGEEMELLAKRYTRFFRKNNPSIRGDGRESLRTKGLKAIKIDEEFYNEVEKPDKAPLNKIKCFKYRKLWNIVANYPHKQNRTNKYAIKAKVTI